MDHSSTSFNVKQDAAQQQQGSYDSYVDEDGKRYRVPYRIIKRVTFSGVSKEELIDIPHAARLQYRLMLMDPVIKATVNFTKLTIMVLFNPREADNIREKMSLDELIEFLGGQGVHVSKDSMELEDYDYYKDLYTYAYTPPEIRERAPYGYTMEAWKEMKPEWEKKMKLGEEEKLRKLEEFREQYISENPEMAHVIDPDRKLAAPKPKTLLDKLMGKSSKKEKGKGFWFHGV